MVPDQHELAHVLHIDDSTAEIMITEHTLERDHIHLQFASVQGGTDALPYLRSKHADNTLPDMILLDLNMPDMDGREVLSFIKNSDALKHIPVVVYSASEAPHDIEETKALGAVSYMPKTINYQKLQDAVACIGTLGLQADGEDAYLIRKTV